MLAHAGRNGRRAVSALIDRAEVVGIFQNEAALPRLVGAILLEQSDEWAVQRSGYMSLASFAPLGDGAPVRLPAVAAWPGPDRPEIAVITPPKLDHGMGHGLTYR